MVLYTPLHQSVKHSIERNSRGKGVVGGSVGLVRSRRKVFEPFLPQRLGNLVAPAPVSVLFELHRVTNAQIQRVDVVPPVGLEVIESCT